MVHHPTVAEAVKQPPKVQQKANRLVEAIVEIALPAQAEHLNQEEA
jgi:hypothetical protein